MRMLTTIASIALASDTKGNLTEYEINGKEYEVDYDLDNRIIKVDIDNDDVEYRYDALGRRVIRQEGTTKTALIWWGNSENAEHKHQAGQTVIQNDIMAHPSRLNSVIARAVDGSKFKLEWYHKNYLDHVYAVSDDSGDILEHYRYTAFGEVTIYNSNGTQVSTTQIDNHILWNTRRRDELTGYYLYKYRHYSAELGRWLARDPIEENGGVNLYGFVGNDPIGRWDVLGLRKAVRIHGFHDFEVRLFYIHFTGERELAEWEVDTPPGKNIYQLDLDQIYGFDDADMSDNVSSSVKSVLKNRAGGLTTVAADLARAYFDITGGSQAKGFRMEVDFDFYYQIGETDCDGEMQWGDEIEINDHIYILHSPSVQGASGAVSITDKDKMQDLIDGLKKEQRSISRIHDNALETAKAAAGI